MINLERHFGTWAVPSGQLSGNTLASFHIETHTQPDKVAWGLAVGEGLQGARGSRGKTWGVPYELALGAQQCLARSA